MGFFSHSLRSARASDFLSTLQHNSKLLLCEKKTRTAVKLWSVLVNHGFVNNSSVFFFLFYF